MNARTALAACLILGIAGLAASGILGFRLLSNERGAVAAAKLQAQADADKAAAEISAALRRAAGSAEAAAARLSEAPVTRAAALEQLRPLVESFQMEVNAGIALDPAAGGRFALQLTGNRDGVRETSIAPDYASLPWFQQALGGESGWLTPAVETPGRGPSFRFIVPLAEPDQDRAAAGFVWISAEFENANRVLNVFQAGPTGWGVLLAPNGDILVHPDSRIIRQGTNVVESARATDDSELLASVERILGGEKILLEAASRYTGEDVWFATGAVEETGWFVVVTRIVDKVLPVSDGRRREIIVIVVVGVIGLVALFGWAGALLFRSTHKVLWLWLAVAACSVALLVATGLVRRASFTPLGDGGLSSVRIQDANALSSFVQARREAAPNLAAVPTGVFINSIKFQSTNETLVTGYIWQKFPLSQPVPEEPDFVLPDAYDPTITLAYVREEDRYRVVGWGLEGVVRQSMNFSRFPFDHDVLSVRLWPRAFDSGVLLVPDLSAYPLTNPEALPGLKQDLAIPGWRISASFFDYQFREFSTDFGLSARRGSAAEPQLRYNVAIQRGLLDPAIQNLVPLIVILAMLFAVLVTSTSNEEETKTLGFNPAGTMRITSALFFVTLVAHIQLRNTLEVQEVVFLEYSYFTVYVVLLFISVHQFLFNMGYGESSIIGYRDSLIFKLFFWPVILAVQFALSIVTFY